MATLSGGVPKDVQDSIIQIIVGIVTALIVKLFNKINNGKTDKGTKEKAK
ncbi:MAG: hypothetical protein RLO17_14630 [Cyclobacteriaceae bacterium]